MLKRVFGVVLLLSLFCSLMALSSAVEPLFGEVMFAQRYADFSSFAETGIRFGTGGGTPTVSFNEGLSVKPEDDLKTYLLLPDLPDGGAWADTYTVEFSFSFTEIAAANGYFGFLMTGKGDVPSNRTELIVRANGTLDGIGAFSDSFKEAMAKGEKVTVTVPVREGMMYEVEAVCGESAETLALPSVKIIGEGSRGFVVRNASVSVESVCVVRGVGYAKKMGKYATESYKMTAGEDDPVAPPTADRASLSLCMLFGAAGCAIFVSRRRRRV